MKLFKKLEGTPEEEIRDLIQILLKPPDPHHL